MSGLRGSMRINDRVGGGVLVIVYGLAFDDAITLHRQKLRILVSTSPLYRFEKWWEKPFLYLHLEYFPF